MKMSGTASGMFVSMIAVTVAMTMLAGAFAPLTAVTNNAFEIAQPPVIQAAAPQPVLVAAPEPIETDTVVIQPNATDGKDAIIWDSVPSANYGVYDTVPVGNGTIERRSLVQFAIPGTIGRLKSATLSLYCSQVQNGPCNISAHAVSSVWDEGTFSGANGAVNWSYRTAGQQWASPGGDFRAAPNSYQEVPVSGAWYSWNVTALVSNWLNGTWVNNGFILVSDNPNIATDNYARFYSSDYAVNTNLTPRLILSYAAEITNPLLAQVMNEDDPARSIPLGGRGAGTVEHQAGPCSAATAYPFGVATQLRYQSVFTPAQVGAEGVLRQISINRSTMDVGIYSDFKIYLAHTNLDNLTNTFANNYNGYLIEVFSEPFVVTNSSDGDTWVHFDLNDNFTYDASFNLLVDIQFSGMSGTTTMSHVTPDVGTKRLWDATGAATGTGNSNRPAFRFFVDAVNNAVIDASTSSNQFPFTTALAFSPMRLQMLYNRTFINQTGIITRLDFQAGFVAGSAAFNGLSIRLAHSSNATMDASFNLHAIDPWVEVFNKSTYAISTGGPPDWIRFDINDLFTYNGIDNLLIDIRWLTSSGTSIWLATNDTLAYDCRAVAFDYSATIATQTNPIIYNLRAIFAQSANLTWSATSSDTGLFTVGIMNNNLFITPQANENGAGTITLRLTNNAGGTVAETIPVTINAVNDAPVLDPLTAITCTEDEPYDLDIASDISDIDDVIGNITVSTDSDYATVNGTVITFLYPEGVTEENVTVTVRDRSGATDSEILAVTVTMVNDDPWFEGFASTAVCEATVSKAIPLYPDDEESNQGQLDISTDSPYANVTGTTLHLLYPKGIGTDQVTIYLMDGQTYGTRNNVSYVLHVTIIDHPEVIVHSPEGTAVPVTTNVQATFDSPMNRTKAESAFSMTLGTIAVSGTFSWTSDSTGMTFTPAGHLTNGLYVVRIAASAENETGVKMLNAFEWNFTAALGDFDGDGDGMPDQWEIDNGLDPNVNDADTDADNDGMPNIYEYESGLDPNVNDADADADGDGATNLEEYEEGTDPNDPESTPSDFGWIIWVIIIVAALAVVVLLVLLMRRKKPAHAGPEPWQEQPGEPGQPGEYQQGQYPPPPPEGQPPQQGP